MRNISSAAKVEEERGPRAKENAEEILGREKTRRIEESAEDDGAIINGDLVLVKVGGDLARSCSDCARL